MLAIGDKITIRNSKKLNDSILINKEGFITRIYMSEDKILGVRADVTIMKHKRNYYIPVDSVDGSSDIDRLRAHNILKATIL